jgi:hypothetical protein
LVLIAHEERFIFIKTKKTGGTSVEEFFEELLLGVPEQGFSESTSERVTESAYVSPRKDTPGREVGYLGSHASSELIARRLGQERFLKYSIVACVRNPWDQIVSFFWWRVARTKYLQKVIARIPIKPLRLVFTMWFICSQRRIRALSFSAQLQVSGELPNLSLVRYEKMQEDLFSICQEMGVARPSAVVPRRKSTQRRNPAPYQQYYYRPIINMVARSRADDLRNFGYSWSELLNKL